MEAEIISAIIAIIASTSFAVIHWQRFKAKLRMLRTFFDILDDALKDDSVSEEEWSAIWKATRKLIYR
jgi:hypothetical protein